MLVFRFLDPPGRFLLGTPFESIPVPSLQVQLQGRHARSVPLAATKPNAHLRLGAANQAQRQMFKVGMKVLPPPLLGCRVTTDDALVGACWMVGRDAGPTSGSARQDCDRGFHRCTGDRSQTVAPWILVSETFQSDGAHRDPSFREIRNRLPNNAYGSPPD